MGLGAKHYITYSLGAKYGLHSSSKLGSKNTKPKHLEQKPKKWVKKKMKLKNEYKDKT